MADSSLADALSGLNVPWTDTTWGRASRGIYAAAPAAISPYASTGSALGIALGGLILGELGRYQAEKTAANQSMEALTTGTQLLNLKTPEERVALIKGVEDTGVQERLSKLALALRGQEMANQLDAQQKAAQLESAAKFEMSPLGQELFKNKLKQTVIEEGIKEGRVPKEYADLFTTPSEVQLPTIPGVSENELRQAIGALPPKDQQKAISEIAIKQLQQPKDFWQTVPAADKTKIVTASGQVTAIRDLADQFERLGGNAITLQAANTLDPNSPENLAIAKMNILVPSTARLLGEMGNLAQGEQERLISATLGSKISGPQAISTRLRQLADTAEGIIKSKTEAYKSAFEGGGQAVLEQMQGRTETEAQRKNRELKERLTRLEALAAKK